MTGRPTLRERLAADAQLVGGIVRMPNESMVEACGYAGFDFLVIDLEHGPGDQIALQHHLGAAGAAGVEVLVRVASADAAEILRVLDLGAVGVVVPHVGAAEQARDVVRAAHYPPLGHRGIATYTRAGQYGTRSAEEHVRIASGRTTVVVMLEDRDACAAAVDILAVDGVDAVLVGPADLGQSLWAHGRDPGEVTQIAAGVHRVARDQGRRVMSIVSTRAAARSALDDGADLVLYNLQALVSATLGEAVRP